MTEMIILWCIAIGMVVSIVVLCSVRRDDDE
jgi:hypothetical protein